MVVGFQPNSHCILMKWINVISEEALMHLTSAVTYAVSCNATNTKPAITATGFFYNATALSIVEHLSH